MDFSIDDIVDCVRHYNNSDDVDIINPPFTKKAGKRTYGAGLKGSRNRLRRRIVCDGCKTDKPGICYDKAQRHETADNTK